jgi:hypothetical protein
MRVFFDKQPVTEMPRHLNGIYFRDLNFKCSQVKCNELVANIWCVFRVLLLAVFNVRERLHWIIV